MSNESKKYKSYKFLESINYSKYTRTELMKMIMNEFNVSRTTAYDYLGNFEYNNNYNTGEKPNIFTQLKLSIGQKCKVTEISHAKEVVERYGRIAYINDNGIGIRIKKDNDSYIETFNVPDLMNDSRKLTLWYVGEWVHFTLKGVRINNKFSFKELIKDDKAS